MTREVNSVPLSLTIMQGCIRISTIRSSSRATRMPQMELSATRARHSRLKALEDENRKLKKLLAESMLDAATLKEMLGKNF